MRVFPALLAVALLVPASGAVGSSPTPADPAASGPVSPGPSVREPRTPTESGPAILSVYPNPIHEDDRGEFVAVRVPEPGNWTIADEQAGVALPDDASGTVVATPDPDLVRPLVDRPVVAVDDALALANGGETVRLRRDGRAVDEAEFGRAPEGERWVPGEGWVPLGATDFAPVAATSTTVEAFALPDAPDVVLDALESADRRILLGAYTASDRRVGRALRAAADRGVDVRVLVEGGPVGGVSRGQARLLHDLVRAGVEVRVVDGPRARYDFHHAKYAVIDDRAVVLSENWKPSGTGGRASRGWGVVVEADRVAAHLARVFRADAGWRDTVPWREFRAGRQFEPDEPADGSYPARFEPRTATASSVRVLLAPDNAGREIRSLLRSAEESVLVQQVAIGDRDHPFLRAALAAARRGVDVRVLLSSAWYVREDNARLVEWLNERAEREGLPLSAKLAAPRSRFEKVHNKGVVVDGEHALVGSVNWNNASVRENREVAVVVSGEAASYYESVFRADWRGERERLPVGLAAAVFATALLAAWVVRGRVEFE